MASNHTYTFQTEDVQGDTFTQLLGINDFNEIVGYHGMAVNQGEVLSLKSGFTSENFPASAQTQVVGVNNSGVTDGFYVDGNGVTHGFIDKHGNFSIVDARNTAFNQLLGINDKHQEVGYSSTDPTGMTMQRAFIVESNGKIEHLHLPSNVNSQATGINDEGTVVGFLQPTSSTSEGFIQEDGHTHLLNVPGSTFTQALGINNLGEVVGDYVDANGNTNGFIFDNGKYTTADVPGATQTTINGINDFGNIVGFDQTPDGVTHGFVGNPLYGLVKGADLNDLIPGLNSQSNANGGQGAGGGQNTFNHFGAADFVSLGFAPANILAHQN